MRRHAAHRCFKRKIFFSKAYFGNLAAFCFAMTLLFGVGSNGIFGQTEPPETKIAVQLKETEKETEKEEKTTTENTPQLSASKSKMRAYIVSGLM